MKKSIIYLSFALVALFSNAATASTTVSATVNSSITAAYGKTITATPLAQAIAKGDVQSVKKFIEYGSDVNETSNDMTPLMIAARYNQVEIINLLLANGASVKTTNAKGYSALKYAQLSNAGEAVTTLTQALKA
jgi:ankyrin repeat protein